ncbi:hypothetical protein Tco_0127347 [Tanacetum coccineum]
MVRFEKTIFKQREEINDRMAEMFRLLKELTTSRTPEKEKNIEYNKVVDKNIVELSELNAIEPKEEVDMNKEVGDETNDDLVRNMEEEMTRDKIKELVEMPRSQPIGYYLKHEINKKLIKVLIGNQIYNDSLLATRLGIAEDVLVEKSGYIYLIDFVILDVKEDKKNPFILGTPFFIMAKAEIRFDKGTINLKTRKNKINFFKILESLCRVEEETENDIDPIAPATTVSRLLLEWEERIKLHQEKEMEFNQWRSKVINDERSALVNEGCEIIYEEGVT